MEVYKRIRVLAEGFEALEVARTKFDAVEFPEAVKIVEKAMIDIHNLIFSKPIEPATQDNTVKPVEKPEEKVELTERSKPDELEYENREDLIWIEINENIRYAYDEENEVFILQYKKDGRFQTLKKFKYEDLKKIWDALPDEATVSDIRSAAKAVGVNTGNLENYLIRIFTHVKFGGDLTSHNRKIGRPCMVLIKNPEGDFSLAEENRRRLEQEREVIGSMYSP
ncbi:hypothetical protein DRP04_05965 [Archaeoglobales archaeon]|nr:MAG: hypothetical protein DRP04_05965 [Archaeoglobales archaeon]